MLFQRHLRGAALSLALVVSCGGGGEVDPPFPSADEPLRVLFIGNSLTYSNDLPAMTAQLAESANASPMVTGRVLRDGYSLADHWDEGVAPGMIREGNWDIVVLQQGPSSLPESQADLLASTRKFAELAGEHGTRVALLMVWPESSRPTARDAVRTSYANAAAAVNGILVPAGEAWRAAWARDPSLKLYSEDGFHPSLTGSYLAALSVYQQLYGRSPVGLPGLGIDPGKVLLLQQSAAEADAEFGRR